MHDLPIDGYITEPIDTGVLEADIRVETTGHSPVDDSLLLLVQQLDQPTLGVDKVIYLTAKRVHESSDSGLFFSGWHKRLDAEEIIRIQAQSTLNNTCRVDLDTSSIQRQPQQIMVIPRLSIVVKAVDAVGR